MGSVAGPVIQAKRRLDFEHGLRMGNQFEVKLGLQGVHTIPEINVTINPGGRADQVTPWADHTHPTFQDPRNQWYSSTAV